MRTKKFMFKQLLMVVAVLFLANACADYGIHDGQGQYGEMNQLIIGGDRATAGWYDAVVSLHETSPTGVYVYPFCTGTLIAEDVVLTAAHCLDVGRRKPRTMSPDSLMIYIGISPVEAFNNGTLSFNDFLYVSETKIHKAYDSWALVNDIAILRLAQPVPSSVATPLPALPAAEGFTSSDIGTTLNFAGFGQDGVGDDANSGVRLEVNHVLGSLGCDVAGCPTPGDAATQIAYTNEIGPCFGDSGGPAFIFRNNAPYVGGITSYGDADCAVYGVSTRVDAYEAWINDFIGTGGEEPPPAGCGDGFCDIAGGESCESCPDDCVISHPKKGVLACCGNGVCEKREDAASCSVDCLP
jgi:secreted trypsin-like serine protease